MNEAQFRHLLLLGHGRAILYASSHDIGDFRQIILDACLHCRAYDPQFEGTRAYYMLDLLDLMPDKQLYCDGVLNALADSKDNWDAVQRFHFAACLALDGNERARELMYESYNPGPMQGEAIAIDFLEMDGIKGLLFAAEKIGALLMSTTEKVDLGWLLSASREKLGEQSTQEALRKAGIENPRIEAYRLMNEASRSRLDESLRNSGELINCPYEQVRPKLPNMTGGWIMSWGQRASEADLDDAGRALAGSRDTKEQYAHLRIFARRRFPLDVQILLNLVDVEQDRVGLAALGALSQIEHPAVRGLAFRLVETRAKWRGQAVALLRKNFQPRDHTTVLRWFGTEDDAETLHSLGMDMTGLWEEHPDEETELPMLNAIYERGPCSFCRERVVRRLIDLGALTGELQAECSHDANWDIRTLVKEPTVTPPH